MKAQEAEEARLKSIQQAQPLSLHPLSSQPSPAAASTANPAEDMDTKDEHNMSNEMIEDEANEWKKCMYCPMACK